MSKEYEQASNTTKANKIRRKVEIFAPLENFQGPEGTSLDLDKDYEIKVVSKKESEHLNGETQGEWQLLLGRNSENPWVLKACYKTNLQEILDHTKGVSDSFDKNRRKLIEEGIALLRLFKAQLTGYKGFVSIEPPETRGMRHVGRKLLRHYNLWSFPGHNDRYKLFSSEAEDFKQFFKKYTSRISYEKPAIRYFNKSYHEPYTNDQLLDLVFALENLYLENKGEFRYKLSMRGAYVLGDDTKSRKEIFQDLKKAYDIRCKIVHGRQGVDADPELVWRVREYLRKSIIKLSEQPDIWEKKKTSCLDSIILKGITK